MKHIKYTFYSVFYPTCKLFWALLLLLLISTINLTAQTDTTYRQLSDTIKTFKQFQADSLSIHLGDSLHVKDSTAKNIEGKKKKSAISSKVEYSATDSISLDLENHKAYMYKDADIKYEKIAQKAAYIEIDFNSSVLKALPANDSLGKPYGMPEFSEGDQTFKSKEMKYNFKTKQGFIKSIITQEGEGYLHGEVVKKMANDVSNMRGGQYTTCDLEHPHYSLRFSKAKVIPKNKIVTGPAYMMIEDVPIPIVLPFGLFPNKRGQTSGIIVPSYGESRERGFYLEGGGYYFGISEYMELKLVGDIYSRGSWAIKPVFNYRKRYKYTGSFNFDYSINTQGVRETSQFQKIRDFRLVWSHRQDPKARPKSQFGASVNFGSRTYNRYNPVNYNDHLTNTFQSSISYSTTFGDKVSFSSALRHSQNNSTKIVNLTLPEIALGVTRFYPLRHSGKISNLKWYDNISMSYNMRASNEVETYDSIMFTNSMLKNFRNGMQHTIPVNLTLKVLKYFSLTNSIDYTERWYTRFVNKEWVNDTLITGNDTVVGYVKTDTIDGFKAARDYGFSSSLNTKLYGMVQFRKGAIRAIRHVATPSISFSYRPDFGSSKYGYYKDVQVDTAGNYAHYSIFGGGDPAGTAFQSLFGTPPMGKSGTVSFSISNNLEMKIRSKSDTITGTKKIMLIESFNLGTSYNIAADSLRWSPLVLNARTTLFKKLGVQYSARFNPYIKNDAGKSLNKFEWDVNNRLFRRESSSWNFSLSYNFSSEKKKTTTNQSTVVMPSQEAEQIIQKPDDYINWNNPWNLSFSYNLNYGDRFSSKTKKYDNTLVQTFGFNGDVNITPKWKVNFVSGYDFEKNKISHASISVYRDLHCWEMRFNWIPIGYLKSWNFYIKVKASILQDLKLNRKKDFRDN
ncbi:MAG: putative LPS assembly protein LptD [Omnitrophica WOR_2 bacterium]